jgi:hypothetical protein
LFKRAKNTDSGTVHGVNPETGKTFCGYPGDSWGLDCPTVRDLERVWYNWKYTDEEVNCGNCQRSIK